MKKIFFLLIAIKFGVISSVHSQIKNYTSLGSFNDGIAPAILNNKLGYINIKGETVIPFAYNMMLTIDDQRFTKNFIYLYSGDRCGVLNYKQDTIVPFKYGMIRTGNGFIDFGKKLSISTVIFSNYGRRSSEEQPSYIGDGFYNINTKKEYFPQNTSYEIKNKFEGKYLAISRSKEGMVIIDSLCNELVSFEKNIFIPELGNKVSAFSRQLYDKQTGNYKYIFGGFLDNETGQIVIEKKYKHYKPFIGEFTFVCDENSKWGTIDNKGKTIIPFIYDEVAYGNEAITSLYAIKKDNKWGYIDKEGKTVIPFKFDYAENFTGKYAVVGFNTSTLKDNSESDFPPTEFSDSQVKNKKEYIKTYSIINSEGWQISSSKFDWISSRYQNGITTAVKGNQILYIDENGKIINKNVRFEIPPNSFGYNYFFDEDLAPIYQNKKWGFINKNGDLKIQTSYDKVNKFKEGFASVLKNGKWFFIDASGKCKINCAD